MTGPTLQELFTLEYIDRDLYRANTVFDEEYNLYGGQVAAQALVAGGLTVDSDRRPHSLHGYFLRAGSSRVPTIFHIFRDRDGHSFSSRRVVALQNGEVIFNASMSFHKPVAGAPEAQSFASPNTQNPETLSPRQIRRLISFEGREVAQPHFDDRPDLAERWPSRLWARCTEPALASDPLLAASAMVYLSDISSGVAAFEHEWFPGPSVDHAVWIHHLDPPEGWLLMDLTPLTITGGRGLYNGSLFDLNGRLIASFAQESLFRSRPPGPAKP